MKRTILKLSAPLLLCFTLAFGLQAQETISATGGEATGDGGSVSYTVGQTFYSTNTGANGNSVAQGVQQPYEISVITAIDEVKGINLEMSVYPNPTTKFLKLIVKSDKFENAIFQLFDIKGQLIKNGKITGSETLINMQSLNPSVYFLKVVDNNIELKTFKIIKIQ